MRQAINNALVKERLTDTALTPKPTIGLRYLQLSFGLVAKLLLFLREIFERGGRLKIMAPFSGQVTIKFFIFLGFLVCTDAVAQYYISCPTGYQVAHTINGAISNGLDGNPDKTCVKYENQGCTQVCIIR